MYANEVEESLRYIVLRLATTVLGLVRRRQITAGDENIEPDVTSSVGILNVRRLPRQSYNERYTVRDNRKNVQSAITCMTDMNGFLISPPEKHPQNICKYLLTIDKIDSISDSAS